jgi:hypothetical protein
MMISRNLPIHISIEGVIEIDQEGYLCRQRGAKLLFKEYSWNHSLSEVFKALMKPGLAD